DGPSRGALEDSVAERALGDRVRFVGRIDDGQLLACYRAADVAVVPSVALEGFGLVVLEALACGTPVIASEVGGLPEVLSPLDRSMLVPPGDAGALADRLASALDGTKPLPDSVRCRRYAERF